MRPLLRARAASQGGLITRVQAVGAGYSLGEIRRLTRADGAWVIVRRGVYAERELWEAADAEGRLRIKDRAAHLLMASPHLMSHDSAARAWGLPHLRATDPLVHVTRFGVHGTRTDEGVKHHLTRLGLMHAEVLDGVRTTGLARTVLDLAREHGFVNGVVACDAALQLGVTLAELEDELALMSYWPGVTQARAALELADAGAESPGETLTRLAILELGIGEPETQFPVQVGDRVFWADMRVGCHLVEFDGMLKVLSPDEGGVATKPAGQVLWDERQRQLEICSQGLGMSRVGWNDLFGARREQTKRRIAAEYAVTETRFGRELPPHLAAFADRVRDRTRSRGRRRRRL